MTIRILPNNLVNQIAAGEVIERPASVVKELVENSIDAGATSIEVTLVDGGKSLIVVSDNGRGIDKDELPVAVERHATSKLPDDNLFNINFLGFRGEALPSISSVSRMTIVSRREGAENAWKIEVNGGEKSEVMPAAHPQGTRIEVRDLFYSAPARLKFLKTTPSETAQCVDILNRIALANPTISFYLSDENKKKVTLNACQGELFEAQKLLADYEKKFLNADKEAQAILNKSQKEIEYLKKENLAKLEEEMKIKEKEAEDRITASKEKAAREISDLTSELTIKTVKAAIVKNLDAKTQNKLIDDSISLITRL